MGQLIQQQQTHHEKQLSEFKSQIQIANERIKTTEDYVKTLQVQIKELQSVIFFFGGSFDSMNSFSITRNYLLLGSKISSLSPSPSPSHFRLIISRTTLD